MTATYDLTNDPLVRAAVEALLNSLWQGFALTALTWACLRAARRTNAATRYGVWFAVLLALVALPPANALLARAGANPAPPEAARQAPGAAADSSAGAQAPGSSDGLDGAAAAESLRPVSVSGRDEFGGERAAATGGLLRPQARQKVELPSGVWMPAVFFGWLLLAGVRAARVAASYGRLGSLKRDSVPLAARYQARLRQSLAAYPRARAARLAASPRISMPMAVGLTDPVILFPQSLIEQLTAEEFDQVLLHELAHVQRRDDWTNFAQKLAEAVLFFHPAVLWVGRRLDLEREVACDDHVICATNEGRRYAVCLARLAELTVMPRRSGLAPGALLSRKHILSRVELLLKQGRHTNPRLSKLGLLPPLGTLAVLLLPCLLLAPAISLAARPGGAGDHDAPAFAESEAEENTRGLVVGSEDWRRGGDGARQESDAGRAVRPAGAAPAPELSRTARVSADPDLTVESAAAASHGSSSQPAAARQDEESALLIDSVSRISSSSDKTAVLLAILEGRSRPDAMPGGFFEAVMTIPSSLDRTRVLSALLERRPGKGLLVRTLKAAEGSTSDSDKTRLLLLASRVSPNDDAVLSAYLDLMATLRSSSDRKTVLSALLGRPGLSRAVLTRARTLALNHTSGPRPQPFVTDNVERRPAE